MGSHPEESRPVSSSKRTPYWLTSITLTRSPVRLSSHFCPTSTIGNDPLRLHESLDEGTALIYKGDPVLSPALDPDEPGINVGLGQTSEEALSIGALHDEAGSRAIRLDLDARIQVRPVSEISDEARLQSQVPKDHPTRSRSGKLGSGLRRGDVDGGDGGGLGALVLHHDQSITAPVVRCQ